MPVYPSILFGPDPLWGMFGGVNPRFSALLRKKPFPIPSPGPPLSPDILIDEEISPVYNSNHFYPAKPGEVLADRYETLIKVGWGVSSTVWLARDLQGHIEEPESIVALKIANKNANLAGHERDVEEHISTADPSHRGRSLMRTFIDAFEIQDKEVSFSCLVYPPMRETLSMYQRRFDDRKMPLPLAKTYIRILLTGLDYLHKECRTVHTGNYIPARFYLSHTDPRRLDLKLDNMMVSFEDPAVLSDFMDIELEKPMAFKIDWIGRSIYQSRTDFGPLKGLQSIPQLVDFGLATRLPENDDWGVWPIQPDPYRAPELGDMIAGKPLFQHIHDQEGRYDPRMHIAEMIALLGAPPPEVIKRYHVMREYPWPQPVKREDGTVCETAEEFFCGPFFDNNGRSLHEHLIPDQKLDDAVPFLEGEEKESFLDLARGMLVWHPNLRKTAGELAKHPFLKPN
ncbi:hypothetical protein N7528_009697 [Penicillium herquei]|nr:hypothetical protein N7528_009697 [Penicillium herquei]